MRSALFLSALIIGIAIQTGKETKSNLDSMKGMLFAFFILVVMDIIELVK